ncbi:MAG: hypothetical protein ABIY51_09855 [Ferruginibacter sp.]
MLLDSKKGKFIVSLDFELMWGVRDIVTSDRYGEHIRGVHQALPRILDTFIKYNIHGTFAVVGLLFFKNKEELSENLPLRKPTYKNSKLSPYGNYLKDSVGPAYPEDPYHYGLHLIKLIECTPNQEIGTHTFCHYYCLEQGQTFEDFEQDLKAAVGIAAKRGIILRSIIFPRNQVNKKYLPACWDAGIISYRDNENSWLYTARSGENESLIRRALRLMDTYINLSGYHCASWPMPEDGLPVNIPSSRFLRPFSPMLRILDPLRLKRIKDSMTYAAKNNLIYHLWWHPHNFGINQKENFAFLEKILIHYTYLEKKYEFKSCTMSELAEELLENRINPEYYAGSI